MERATALADFLADLRGRGLSVGIREHLAVGRLMARFDSADVDTLRDALASLLARNPGEVALVREEFDRRYVAPAVKTKRPPPPPRTVWSRLLEAWRSVRARLRLRWIAWAGALLLLTSLIWLIAQYRQPIVPPGISERPTEAQPSRQVRDALEGLGYAVNDTPVPKLNFPTPPSTVNWKRAALAASGAAFLAFLVLYVARTRRDAGRRGRARWGEEASRLPGPNDYELRVQIPLFPVRGQDLDDVATILGRRVAAAARGRELDVDRTLERTIRAGLAPQLVLRAPRFAESTIVLEDVSESMQVHRFLVRHVLEGLSARGVAVQRWCFDSDATRVWRAADRISITLKQLLRLQGESAVLVVSDGLGVLDGTTFRLAPWVDMLRGWRSRAWVHPNADRAYWHAGTRQVPCEVRPMTAPGLLAAARDLSRADVRAPAFSGAEPADEPAVVPFDVERLRWLISMAQRREPELVELLRQRFCPTVPRAAVAEALKAPPLVAPLPVGPSAVEVHAFLGELLEASRPEEGTMAFERWRLDRALQAIDVDVTRTSALAELSELAKGPLAADVEDRLAQLGVPGAPGAHRFARMPLARDTSSALTGSIIRPIARRARREGFTDSGVTGRADNRWTHPRLGEFAACAVTAVVALAGAPRMGPLVVDRAPATVWAYDLTLGVESSPFGGRLELTRRPELRGDKNFAPDEVEIFRTGQSVGRLTLDRSGVAHFTPTSEQRGAYFHVQAKLASGTIAISQLVEVPSAVAQHVVPKLVGMTVAQATRALAAADLKLGHVAHQIPTVGPGQREVAPPRPTDVVVSQDARAGTRARSGAVVNVVTKTPEVKPKSVEVPNLRGLLPAEARRVLAGVNLKLGKVSPFNSAEWPNSQSIPSAKVGAVLMQYPRPGLKVPDGTAVNVELWQPSAATPKTVAVPRLIGMTLPEAEKTLAAANLKLAEEAGNGNASNPRQRQVEEVVRSQNPNAGARVLEGSTVNVDVQDQAATTPKLVPVPQLMGMIVSGVEKELAAVNLRLGSVTPRGDPDSAQRPGANRAMVLAQKPEAGANVAAGSAVDIVVGFVTDSQPADVQVPNLYGMSLDQASKALILVGLKLGNVERRDGARKASASAPPAREVIVDQKPRAGELVAKGTAVDVVVQVDPPARKGARSS